MKNLHKIQGLFRVLFLLMAFCAVHAAKCINPSSVQAQKVNGRVGLPGAKLKLLAHGYCRKYDVPKEVGLFIIYFLYDNPLQYKNKNLPNDLSGQDLSGFDFTGCQFAYTNLSDTNLASVVLTNTTCDYQKAFQDNLKKNKLQGGNWYQNNLPLDLESIAEVYPRLNNDTHKAKLLHIACGFSRLPFYEGTEFYIKVAYWSSELVQLKQTLGLGFFEYGNQLICSLESALEYDANDYCWSTNYPQDKVSIDAKPLHANFAQYLQDFTNGLKQYQCKSKKDWGFNYYKIQISKNIEGLKATYPHIKEVPLQQQACNIAHALSKSYQIEKGAFLNHFLFFQNQLIWSKKLVRLGVKNKIHYNSKPKAWVSRSWKSMT